MASKFDELVDAIKDPVLKAMARNGASTSDLLFRVHRKNDDDIEAIFNLDRSLLRQNRQDAPRTLPDHGDGGNYGDLGSRARRHGGQDGLEYDHIPSEAALLLALQRHLDRPLEPWERNAVSRDATAVALTDAQHRNGATWGSQNRQHIDGDAGGAPDPTDQQISDALNAAQDRDLDAHAATLAAEGMPQSEIDEIIQTVRDLNEGRGWQR